MPTEPSPVGGVRGDASERVVSDFEGVADVERVSIPVSSLREVCLRVRYGLLVRVFRSNENTKNFLLRNYIKRFVRLTFIT